MPFVVISAVTASLLYLIFITNDFETAIYTQMGVVSGLLIFTLLMMKPFWGLILIIVFTYFAHLFSVPFIESVNKVAGIPVAIGWFLKYFVREKTVFFKLMDYNVFLLLFISSMIFSSLLALDPVISFRKTLIISLNILMIFFMQDLINSKERLNVFIIAVALSAGLSSLVGIIQYITYQTGASLIGNVHVGEEDVIRVSGFGSANSYGLFLFSCLPFLLFLAQNAGKFISRLLFGCLFFTTLICTGLTISRTAIFGSAIFLLVYFFMHIKDKAFSRKQLVSYVLVIVIIALSMSFFLFDVIRQRDLTLHDSSSLERYNVLVKSLYLLVTNPVFGIGFNNISLEDNPEGISLVSGREGHDIVSLLFVSVGLFGGLVFILLCYRVLKYYSKSGKYFSMTNDKYLLNLSASLRAGFISILLTGFGSSPADYRLFWIHAGLACILSHRIMKDKFSRYNYSS